MAKLKATKASRSIGFDTPTYVTPEKARQFLGAGYDFVIRYVGRSKRVDTEPDTSSWMVSLSKRELAELTSAGMAVSIVQFAKFTGRPYLNEEYGLKIGGAAAYNVRGLGVPKGVTVWCDAEWSDNPSREQVIAYLNGWASAVSGAGYRPGVYVGWTGLSGLDWYMLPKYRHYWKSASAMPFVEKRGYQMIQALERSPKRKNAVFGLDIDQNLSCIDAKGDRFYWVRAK